MPKVAMIVYGEATGIDRRLIVADSIEELGQARHYGPGEGTIILDAATVTKRGIPDLPTMQAMIAGKRGKEADPSRVVVLDDVTGEVERVLKADPLLDLLPGKTLVAHAELDVGWTIDTKTGEYVEPEKETIIPAGTLDLITKIPSDAERKIISGGRRVILAKL